MTVGPRHKNWVRGVATKETLGDMKFREDTPLLGLLDICVDPWLNEPRHHEEVLKADSPPFQAWRADHLIQTNIKILGQKLSSSPSPQGAHEA